MIPNLEFPPQFTLRPNVASAAPLNLESVSAQFFSVEELTAQLSGHRPDVESCCRAIPASTQRGKPLVLPNLKLKVVMEAIRMVLEIVYDDGFVTFSYGGRANMGSHIAIRYLKNSVENPSWWFSVTFNREKLGTNHIAKLCLIIGEKIKDNALIDLIKKLCKCEAISIELGGCNLGRGFPQECRLSSILLNIYFNSFDNEIQEMRQIFKTWSKDVVKQFLESVDERWEWHRQLSAGDFLSLGRIREQLTRELIDAYDNFQGQVDST